MNNSCFPARFDTNFLEAMSKTATTMPKAFAYLRVSGKRQVDGDGFPRQAAAIKAYAAANNLRIVKTFREEGVSGANDMADRPQFARMARTRE